MKKRSWLIPLILLLLIGQISFFDCTSQPPVKPVVIQPVLPALPVLEPVAWTDDGAGLHLTYAEYRKLETNLLRMRTYDIDLLATIKYYQSITQP